MKEESKGGNNESGDESGEDKNDREAEVKPADKPKYDKKTDFFDSLTNSTLEKRPDGPR